MTAKNAAVFVLTRLTQLQECAQRASARSLIELGIFTLAVVMFVGTLLMGLWLIAACFVVPIIFVIGGFMHFTGRVRLMNQNAVLERIRRQNYVTLETVVTGLAIGTAVAAIGIGLHLR